MGISGLLPLLKSIHRPCNLAKFSGQAIGVDAYGWLHRGTVSCAVDLALDRPTTKYVDFAMSRIRMLKHFGLIPYVVFDGDHLPSKAATEVDRANKREESRRLGLELHRMGKLSQAQQELQKAVDVTPYMARLFIEELKKSNVQYVVAPYEADAQLVYLEKRGIISGILSEDSDMLVFGAKRLLTKLDQYGDCVEINRSEFTAVRDISLIGWDDTDFRRMAILSGCDYLTNISKMGLKTAYRYVRKYKSIERVLQMLALEGQFRVPPGYLKDFKQAELTFLHQRVFCPTAKQLVMLTDLDHATKEADLPFIGASVDQETAIGVACGDLDPMTKESIVLKSQQKSRSRLRSTIAGESDLKDIKKPIDLFFKPKRQPLAELDPNMFTPSPTQQRLLETGGRSWNSSPAPSGSRTNRSLLSLPDTRPSPSPSLRSRHREDWLVRAAALPPQLPPSKRQRLCSDAIDGGGRSNHEASKSRFFPPPRAATSPPNSKMKRNKTKNSEVNIWSDDSIEDVMAQLPDFFEPIKTPKISVFIDLGVASAACASPGLIPVDSQPSTFTSETSALSTMTTEISVADSYEESDLVEENKSHSEEVGAKHIQQFSYHPGTDKTPSAKNIVSTKEKSPLAKVRRRNANLQKDVDIASPPLNDIESLSRTTGIIARTPTPELPLPRATPSASKGSEDLIVPNSEDEPEWTEQEKTPSLCVEKFMFTPR